MTPRKLTEEECARFRAAWDAMNRRPLSQQIVINQASIGRCERLGRKLDYFLARVRGIVSR